MSQFTIFVTSLSDAVTYYESVFGFIIQSEENPQEGKMYLSSGSRINLGTSLVIIEDEKSAYVQLINKSVQVIEWHSTQFWEDYHAFSAFGMVFESLPTEKKGVTGVRFIDAYGIPWNLIGTLGK